MSKLFEKLILCHLKPLIEESYRTISLNSEKHSTIEGVHRVTNEISKTLEEKKYFCGVFLDVA